MAYSTVEASITWYATGGEILLSSATVFVKDLEGRTVVEDTTPRGFDGGLCAIELSNL
jgi:hypothetical protein